MIGIKWLSMQHCFIFAKYETSEKSACKSGSKIFSFDVCVPIFLSMQDEIYTCRLSAMHVNHMSTT